MPPALPASLHRPARRRPRALALAAALALGVCAAGAAHALTVEVSAPYERDGRLLVATSLRDPFDARVAHSLQGGLPITVSVRAELWQRRNGWFDRQESGYDAVLRVGYETLKDRYRMERSGAPTAYFASLDSLARFVTRPWSVPVATLDRLQRGRSYYVTVHATLKPMTLEDAAEVEGWLAGDPDDGSTGFGFLAGLPRALFEAARGLAGFGDRQARAVSGPYTRR